MSNNTITEQKQVYVKLHKAKMRKCKWTVYVRYIRKF